MYALAAGIVGVIFAVLCFRKAFGDTIGAYYFLYEEEAERLEDIMTEKNVDHWLEYRQVKANADKYSKKMTTWVMSSMILLAVSIFLIAYAIIL